LETIKKKEEERQRKRMREEEERRIKEGVEGLNRRKKDPKRRKGQQGKLKWEMDKIAEDEGEEGGEEEGEEEEEGKGLEEEEEEEEGEEREEEEEENCRQYHQRASSGELLQTTAETDVSIQPSPLKNLKLTDSLEGEEIAGMRNGDRNEGEDAVVGW
jgi:hypothetical protein